MPRWLDLWRTVLHRGRAEWPIVLAAFLLLLSATTLLAAGVLYADSVADGGLRRAVLDSPVGERTAVVRVVAPAAEAPALDAAVRPEVERSLRATGGQVAFVIRTESFADAATDPGDVRDLTSFMGSEALEAHAELVDGRWPTAGATPVEAALSEGAATALGVAPGDRLRLVARIGAASTVEVVIVGVVRPRATDPFWLADPLGLTGSVPGTSFAQRGPLFVAPVDLLTGIAADARAVILEWRGLPDVAGLRADTIDPLAEDVATLGPRLDSALASGAEATVSTGLPARLAAVSRSVLVSRSGIVLLTAQFAVLAGYAILLVAGMLADRRRTENALLRSRGASTGHLAAMALLEALVIAIPTAVLAPLLALGIVRALGSVGPLGEAGLLDGAVLTPAVLGVSVLASALGVLALVLPSLPTGGPLAGVRASVARQTGRTLPQRLGIDLALLVVAVLALWQLRLYGAPITANARGVLGVDPLLVAAPAIGLAAGAVVAIRLLPRLAEIAERALEGTRGLVSPLGARQLARRPLRYTRAALLLMLAVALGTFAVAHAATWSGSQKDQAAYRAAADVRVVAPETALRSSWSIGQGHRALPGVTAAMPVARQALDVGRTIRDGQLLALPGDVGAPMLAVPGSLVAADPRPALAALAAARPSVPAVPLPDEPTAIRVTLDTALVLLEPDPDTPPGGGPDPRAGIEVAAVVVDGDGRLTRFAGGRVPLEGERTTTEIPLVATVDGRTVGPRGPVSLVALELTVAAPAFAIVGGTIELGPVEATDAGDGTAAIAWRPLSLDPGAADWHWLRIEQRVYEPTIVEPYLPPDGAPGRIVVGQGDGAAPPIFGSPADPGVVFRLQARPEPVPALPAIVGRAFADATGAVVGDTVAATSYGQALRLRVEAIVDGFAPLDPDRPFVVVDAPSLELVRFDEVGTVVPAGEWWLAVEPGREPDVLAALAASADPPAEVVGREALARTMATAPVPLGVIGALGIGAIAALAFAAIGFVVSASVSTEERVGEFALLRALGLSRSQLSAWMTLESAFLLVVGVMVGSALGILLAWLVLPFATLTETGAPTVPAAQVVVPWAALVPLWLIAGALLAVTVVLVGRRLGGIGLAGVLRARDE